ncbi:MAG: DegT/DnrJ/EryC1/StrS family aminotransferase [Planctomycetota bacterium]
MHRVPFLDLRVQDPTARKRLLTAIDRVLQHGRLVLGPEVDAFEAAIAERIGCRHAVGVGSGSGALYLALRALEIGPGDEVVTTAMSWVATANAITLTGATPVFADVDDDLNLDAASVAELVTDRTRALLPVHYNGRLCDMDALLQIARKHDLTVIEDAAQAFGASDAAGRQAGSIGRLGCFSMNPMKVLAACGEAGCVVTNDAQLAERLVSLRYNGLHEREDCRNPSVNGRLDTIQAAILNERLTTIDDELAQRRQLAQLYDHGLQQVSGVIATPRQDTSEQHAYYTYTIRAAQRDALQQSLAAQGIETKIRHPLLMPAQQAYCKTARGAWPRAARRVEEILSLPMHCGLSRDDVAVVIAAIDNFYKEHGAQ